MVAMCWHGNVFAHGSVSPADVARQVLSSPDDRLDYAEAKLAFDHIVDRR
jgi:hypothetical protein